MKRLSVLLAYGVLVASCTPAEDAGPSVPLEDGEYVFSHRFAEHPNISSIEVRVQLSGNRITVINDNEDSVFPVGLLESGTLMWHSGASRWVIVESAEELSATEVGGCSDGPTTIDLDQRIFWTC